MNIPEVFKKWKLAWGLELNNVFVEEKRNIAFDQLIFPSDTSSSIIIVFRETSTKTKFYFEAPSLGHIDETGNFSGILSPNSHYYGRIEYVNKEVYKLDEQNQKCYLITSCVIIFEEENIKDDRIKYHNTFVTIHTHYDPDKFDFDAELIRSEKI